ncbi:hypothetical protein BJ912DRAFT_1131631 [Pholiota molesta]|nr:hypothetical protein BJ912DRAFT_1131631 [Pholiota molesta]
MLLPTPISTQEDMEISEVSGHLNSIINESSPVLPLLEQEEPNEVIEGSVAGEDENPTIRDDFEISTINAPKIPETPPKSFFFRAKSLSKSNQVARANNFLQCYNEVPQSPSLPRNSESVRTSHLGSISPAPRRVNLRPFWKGEYERMSALLEETEAKLLRTEYQLYLANQEIARLKEFDGNVHLGLEEIARQRAFMIKVGAILAKGKFDDEDPIEI